MVAPIFETVAHEFADAAVHVRHVAAEGAPTLVDTLGVRSFPTVVLCFNGKIVDAVVGRLDAEALARRIQWLLERAPTPQGLLSRLFGARRVSG